MLYKLNTSLYISLNIRFRIKRKLRKMCFSHKEILFVN